jgi:formate/nitrite transporter FocA (FNT family)
MVGVPEVNRSERRVLVLAAAAGVLLVTGIVLLNIPRTWHSPFLSLLAGVCAGAGLAAVVVVTLVSRRP